MPDMVATARLRFNLLGPLEAWYDDTPVELGDLQQRLTVAVLVLHANRPVRTERLVELVWHGQQKQPGNPGNAIAGYVSRLNGAFSAAGAGKPIQRIDGGYQLALSPEGLDTNRLTSLRDAAAAVRAADPTRARELLRAAVALRRGSFLEDLDAARVGDPDVVPSEDAYLDVVCDLAELELTVEPVNPRWVRDALRPVQRERPENQQVTALLMRAFLLLRDEVSVVEIYQATKRLLEEEYGLEPSPQLRGLNRVAKRGGPGTGLPTRPLRFTGRAAELTLITETAAQLAGHGDAGTGDAPVIWISGMPGAGKTALALQAAYESRERFPDGQVFVSLNGFTPGVAPTSPADALAELLVGLGLPTEQIPPQTAARAELYQTRLIDAQVLVVLDNAASEEQTRELLPRSPSCLAVVTSRRAGGLSATEPIHLEELGQAEAVALFTNLAGRARVGAMPELVTRIVALCNRLPSQILPVATLFRRHRNWPLTHLADLLEQAGVAGVEGGAEATTVAFTVSYGQLSEAQRTLFRLLGAIPALDVAPDAAAALTGSTTVTTRALLDDLCVVSLADEFPPGRYRLLDPLKEFAATLIPDTLGEVDSARLRLLDFYQCSTAAAVGALFAFDSANQPVPPTRSAYARVFTDTKDALAWLTVERTNLIAAIDHAAVHGRAGHVWRLAVLLWRHFYVAGHVESLRHTLQIADRVLAADPRPDTDTTPTARAQVLLRLANAYWLTGAFDLGLEAAARAMPIWAEAGDTRGEADTYGALGLLHLGQGDHRLALDQYQAAMDRYRSVQQVSGLANALSMLGMVEEELGKFAEAQAHTLEAIPLLKQINHLPGLVSALNELAFVRLRLGSVDQAMADYQQAHELSVTTGDRAGQVMAQTGMGNAHRAARRFDEALRLHRAARASAEEIGMPELRAAVHLDLGDTLYERREPAAAATEYQLALNQLTSRSKQAHAHHGLAKALHVLDRHEEAADHWRVALSAFAEFGLPEADGIRSVLGAMACACAQDRG